MDRSKHKDRIKAARRRRRIHYTRWSKKVMGGIVPVRASTQTWMIMTFALFVGLAVMLVGFYVSFVLRTEVNNTVQRDLFAHAERVASAVEQANSASARQAVVDEYSRTTGLHVTAAINGDVYTGLLGNPSIAPYVTEVSDGPNAVSVLSGMRETVETEDSPYVRMAIYHARPEVAVRVARTAGPLITVMDRVGAALLTGLVFILLLSLLGSWIAARQVVKPLHAIRRSAHSISEGKFDEKIRVESRAAEFQDLAGRLNQMSTGFREKIDELERLARLQNEFIGNVSHEVRNPIFAISGYLEALSTPTLKDDQRKRYAEKGLSNLQRLNNLFNDLIEIARLEYREDLIQPRVFDLQLLVDEVGEMLRPKAEEKNLNLEIDNLSVNVEADRNRIRQVLINLIDNAIAYTDEGTIRCRFRRRLDKVRVEVIDTGRGISEEHLDRVFERFHRVDPDRSRRSGGTGLGLSIVKQILHAHGEQIHLESTFGRGSRFWFELPYVETTEEVEPA